MNIISRSLADNRIECMGCMHCAINDVFYNVASRADTTVITEYKIQEYFESHILPSRDIPSSLNLSCLPLWPNISEREAPLPSLEFTPNKELSNTYSLTWAFKLSKGEII